MKGNPRIRRRMTAWFAASVFVLLLLSILAMRSIARGALAVQHEVAVLRNVDLVRSFFRAELSEYRYIEATLGHIAGELVFAGMGLEFLRPDSSDFAQARLPNPKAAPRAPIRTYVVPLEPDLAPGWKLRLRVSVADLASAHRRIDQATLIALPLAVALAALAGWLVTGRALRPVGMMADAAERIDASVPSARLPIADEHDELGRLGRRFNALLDRLDGALAQQRRFLADAAHELRTPMARMLGEAETRLALPPSSDDRQSVERIHDDLRRASSLVDELMQLARADAGSADTVMQATYLDDEVSDALAPWHAEARRRNIALSIPVLEESPITGDPKLIHRLVGVLLHNALQYTPAGGRIEVRVLNRDGQRVLEVEDSGIGIPAGERERVFERFYRGTTARQRAPEGSGLGLAIAAWVAQRHGATISVGEGTAEGALFRVAFPAPQPPGAAQVGRPASGASPRQR